MQNLSEQDRTALASSLMRLFDNWKVDNADRMNLFGLPSDARSRWLNGYRQGTRALPNDEDILKRAEYFLAINESLMTTFPHSRAVSSVWMHTKNRKLDNQSPIKLMLAGGLDGIYEVLCHLDCTQNWITY